MTKTFAGLALETMEETGADYGRWLIHGPQGAGKSTLASTIAILGPTLFVDLRGEHGTRSFKGSPWEGNITVVRPKSITDLDDLFWALHKGGHGYKAVVLDSLTSVQKMAMRFLMGHDETAVREIQQGTAPADQRTWGQSLDVMTDIATFWYELANSDREEPMHVVMTAQTKVIEEEGTGLTLHQPDVQKGALSIVKSSPDYIVYCDVLEEMNDDGQTVAQHVVRFGSHPTYSTKGRLPFHLRGKIPSILGRKSPTSLADLSRVLGLGGVPAAKKAPAKKTAAKAPAAASA